MSSGNPRFAAARAVADSVLYEGYLLYPYRKSSGKNQMRWQFGVLPPPRWAEGRGPVVDGVAGSTEWWFSQTECLLETRPEAHLHVLVRFLQLQTKTVEEPVAPDSYRPVERLSLDDRLEVSFEEAVPHEVEVSCPLTDLGREPQHYPMQAPAGASIEPLVDRTGRPRGRLVRRRLEVAGELQVAAERVEAPFPLHRLNLRLSNTDQSTPAGASREKALQRSFIAAHLLLAVDSGSFVSLLDPPAWATPAAADCRNLRTFPVLAGPNDAADLVISAPLILYDHPQVSPESPTDLHDATEIDEILSLRTLTLSDEEKREARGTDPRAAAIVDWVDSMPSDVMAGLHGVLRSEPPPTEPGRHEPASSVLSLDGPSDPREQTASPETDGVVVDGVWVANGSRVRLRPRRRGSDAADMFLAGRRASVQAVFADLDGRCHVAVTVDDDPSAELHQWYGRFHYFAPEELEPLESERGVPR